MKILIFLATLICVPGAFAIDTSNRSNVNSLRGLFFGAPVEPGATREQTGKSATDEKCTLKITDSRYDVTVELESGKTAVLFRASISGKTSSHYEVLDSDENKIEVRQIASMDEPFSMDERGSCAVKQYLNVLTRERPGETGINNVREITITSQYTDEWTTEGLTCAFD